MVGKTMYGTIRGNGGRNTKSTAACADDTALRFLYMKQEEMETALANDDA